MRKTAGTVLAAVLLTNIAVWSLINRPDDGKPWAGQISGVSYSPYQKDQSPENGNHPSFEDVRHDMRVLSGNVKSVRTYTTLNGAEFVPEIADQPDVNLSVTAGAWLGTDKASNEAEIANIIRLTKAHKSIRRLIVGNETQIRKDVSLEDLYSYLDRVRGQVSVPVSTAETWDVWLKYPELADHVDYIAIHILPYWEEKPVEQALDHVRNIVTRIQGRFPDKHIVIGETGWPSDGQAKGASKPSSVNQAKFIREFLSYATDQHIDYFLMEAFDQPWKQTLEGTAGSYWGVFDADRHPKFRMTGPILEVPEWPMLCLIATLIALPALLFVILRRTDLHTKGQIFYGIVIQLAVSMVVWSIANSLVTGRAPSTEIAWSFLIACQVALLIVMLIDAMELTEVVWSRRRRRHFEPIRTPIDPATAPKVSIHVPCYNEPPHMVIETMNALARMDYPNFEVLVIDNNTKDDAVWKPLEEHAAKLGPRFRFFHLPKWPGYKAGALNFGLTQTAPDAEVVGVIDSDYLVTPDWLSATIPYFQKPEVGFVQSPQDYRDCNDTFLSMCNWEYQGFFHIGMIQRNERNAIIQHGTMTLVRKTALESCGRWSEWCICEDAELGLRLFENKYEAVYMPDSFGQGLVPDSFEGYKTQRWRWAYGAVQILKRHWREMLPGAKRLTFGQKYHFITGWMPWFADAAHLVFASAAVFWSLGLLVAPVVQLIKEMDNPAMKPVLDVLIYISRYFEFPPAVFMLPTVTVFGFKILGSLWLYAARVKCRFIDKVGAAVAGMALTHTVGRAVWQGLFTAGRPFIRTPKCADKPALVQGLMHAREELSLMAGLWGVAGLIVYCYPGNRDAMLWSAMLLVQSLPYVAALILSMISALAGMPFFQKKQG